MTGIAQAERVEVAPNLDEHTLWQEITRIARTALRESDPEARDGGSQGARFSAQAASGEVFEVRAQPLLHAADGPPIVLVAIRPTTERLPDLEEVRERFGLSLRQGQVALLLARRLSTKEIADELGISRHTARRHVEIAMMRLRVHSRTDIADVLRRPPAPDGQRRAAGAAG